MQVRILRGGTSILTADFDLTARLTWKDPRTRKTVSRELTYVVDASGSQN